MKRLFKLALLAFTLTLTLFISTSVSMHAQEATTLRINYYRFDETYSGWSLWLWQNKPASGDGQNNNFNGYHDGTGARQFEYNLAGTYLEGATEVGVIVRTGSWVKDVPMDLFIDMTNPDSNGVVEVFLVTEDPNVYYDESEVDFSHRVQRVDFSDTNRVRFTATSPLSQSDVAVYADGIAQGITDYTSVDNTSTITLSEDADLTKEYTLGVNFNDGEGEKTYEIGFRGIYNSETFNNMYAYDGELGALYEDGSTTFKLWAPISTDVTLNLYTEGHPSNITSFDGQVGVDIPYETHTMTALDKGVWEVTVPGDLHGIYYTYSVTNSNQTNEVVDPYTRSTGVNGLRGMVVDFDRLNPENWTYGSRPQTINHFTESIVYEAHIRDYTSHETWNGTESWRGKYLGFQEMGTRYEGLKTGFDHFVDLGITHVQLLPVHDIGMAIDETRIEDPNYSGRMDTVFNWGYMTLHFNTLEGSYATDPFDGSVRIEEFKQLVQTFHENDIRVVLDVVYNHTATSGDSNFEKILPGYYFRFTEEGQFSNGSGTGNETASEHAMMRKFMVDSLTFWTEEYNISGYRFDLMKLHDVQTMQEIQQALHAIDDTILVYGEPWTGGATPLPDHLSAYKGTLDQMPGVGVFNDDTRDGIKGCTFNCPPSQGGFVQGVSGNNNRLRLGIVGGITHPDINGWATSPYQSVNYVTAHDNNTLHDKLMLSVEDPSDFEIIKNMQKQANAIVLTSQGLPFLHGGVEMMRTKPCVVINGQAQGECDNNLLYDHNSYRSPDETNQIDWNWKKDHYDVFEYYKGLIALRRNIDVFSYQTAQEVRNNLTFDSTNDGLVSYFIYDDSSAWEMTLVAHNNATATRYLDLRGVTWEMVVNRDQAGLETIETVSGSTLALRPNETVVLYSLARGAEWPVIPDDTTPGDGDDNGIIDDDEPDESSGLGAGMIALISAGVVVGVGAIATGTVLLLKKKPF